MYESAINEKDEKSDDTFSAIIDQSAIDEDDGDDGTMAKKMWKVFFLAVPSILCSLVCMMQEMINLVMLGHLNKPDLLAGVGIGNMFANMMGLSIVVGLNGALETLISQAYGAGDIKLCGVYLNRGRFVLLAFFVPVSFILFQTETILVWSGQNPVVCKHAHDYVIAFLPGLILSGLNDSQRRFLNMIGKTTVPLVC